MADWIEESRAIRAQREVEEAERKARGPKPRKVLRLKCVLCGDSFEATRKDAKFCCATCRSIARHRAEREKLPFLKQRKLRRR